MSEWTGPFTGAREIGSWCFDLRLSGLTLVHGARVEDPGGPVETLVDDDLRHLTLDNIEVNIKQVIENQHQH